MASLSKVLIVVLRPDLKVRYVHTLSGDSATLPLLAWHFVVIQLSDTDKVIDPVLAFARDQTVFFVQVGYQIIRQLICYYPFVNLSFIGLLYVLNTYYSPISFIKNVENLANKHS